MSRLYKQFSCGPDWLPNCIKKLLFGWFFEASCKKHDEGYDLGGRESDRRRCDVLFLCAMLRDTLDLKWYQRLIATVVALVFFMLVRMFGWTQFYYHDMTFK